ncbi:MAG: metallophosphoesterase [Thermoplasmata archaeon]
MGRFAHISDVHLAAFDENNLRETNLNSFLWALDECKKRNVDFIIITGDIFNRPNPDFLSIKDAIKKMREIVNNGIHIYTISGSHDFSITGSSIYNILDATGIIIDVHRENIDGDNIYLEPTVDEKTGASLYGMYGRRMGLESYDYSKIKIKERNGYFSIFLFHSAISEVIPDIQFHMSEIPLEQIPKNMSYYAGGHVHRRIEKRIENYSIFYPGPLFASNYQDLEAMAKGEKRGFFIVDFSEKIENVEFVENNVIPPILFEINAEGKIPEEIMREAIEKIEKEDLNNKYVLLKIYGELSSGKISEINRKKIIDYVKNKGAKGINININSLKSREYPEKIIPADNVIDVEKNVFETYLKEYRTRENALNGENGVKLAISLFNELKINRSEEENSQDFENRITDAAKRIFKEEEWK